MIYLWTKVFNILLVSANDIIGDVSYEELRAVAYDDANCGLSLQAVVRKSSTIFFFFFFTY